MEMSGGELSDQSHLLRSNGEGDVEVGGGGGGNSKSKGIKDLLKHHLDRGFSGRRLSFKRLESNRERDLHNHHHSSFDHADLGDALGDSAPPEWALLLIGCLLGLATGLCVAAFNRGVRFSSLASFFRFCWSGSVISCFLNTDSFLVFLGKIWISFINTYE